MLSLPDRRDSAADVVPYALVGSCIGLWAIILLVLTMCCVTKETSNNVVEEPKSKTKEHQLQLE
jgi:hypothetical protein